VSPIGGEGCAARRRGRSTWRVTESVERLARASRAGDQHTLTANGRRCAGGSGRVFRKYRVRIVGVWFRFVLNVDGASDTMVLIGMVFGKVVGAITDPTSPVDNELALANTVADPVKTHVHGFGAFLFDGVVGDARSSAVVSDNGSRWLGMSKFFKSDALGDGLFSVVVEASHFGFGSTGENFFKNFAGDIDGAVEWWLIGGWLGGIIELVA